MLKHLGDLCADVDSWGKASALYGETARQLAQPLPAAWATLVASLQAIIAQSEATAERNVNGPARSARRLADALSSANLRSSPLLIANATFDVLTAAMAAAQSLPDVRDQRATVMFPPLLQASHTLSSAIQSSLDGDFQDAHRRFWAALRRQTALGSSTESRHIKAAYARSLVDELAKNITSQRHPEVFRLAVTLLLESGSNKAVARVSWNEILVETYVDQACVDFVISHAESQLGARPERRWVAVEIFLAWIVHASVGQTEAARAMLRYVASLAFQSTTSIYTPANLGGRSLEILRQVALERPELGAEAAHEVAAAVTEKLRNAEVWTGRRAALETASAYLDAFSQEQLKPVLNETLSFLDGLAPEAAVQPILGPALEVLVSEPSIRLSRLDLNLGQRIVSTILRLGLQQGGESGRVFSYLHKFDAALLRNASIATALAPVVAEVRRMSQQTNSSNVTACIHALLLAPALSGQDGVRDALDGLERVISSASGKAPSMGLPLAYDPLLLLAARKREIAEDLSLSPTRFHEWLEPLLARVIDLWSAGKENPLIFSAFSLPPATRPNPTIVHNWAYASLAFAAALGREDEVQTALVGAMAQPALADSVALARATRSVAGDADAVDATAIRGEKRDTFYSALGARLVALQRFEEVRAREICLSLLDQCFRFGPKPTDAAVFLAAVRLNLAGHVPDVAYSNYIKRLGIRDRELRLFLMPILELLKPLP